jgi:hypothetical protein
MKQDILAEYLRSHTFYLKRASTILPGSEFLFDKIRESLEFLETSCKIVRVSGIRTRLRAGRCMMERFAVAPMPFASMTSA